MPGMTDYTKPKYDQSTYLGRLYHFSELTDPRNLFASSAQLKAAQETLRTANEKQPSLEKFYAAKKLVSSSIHPDTHEPIFLPFRMASFVPSTLI
jgi:sideroflexin-5